MFGFSIPKLLLLFIILLIIWNLFKFLENKSRSSIKKKSQYDEEALTECNKCGGFYDKSIKTKCPMCTSKVNK